MKSIHYRPHSTYEATIVEYRKLYQEYLNSMTDYEARIDRLVTSNHAYHIENQALRAIIQRQQQEIQRLSK